MFRQIAGFELRYQARSPIFWVTTLIFALLTFGTIASDSVRIGGLEGNVKKNSPFAVAVTLQTMSLFAVFIMAAFVANVVVRDDETGYGQIVHSTRVSRFDYLFGRFTGAFAAGCLAFAGVPLALLLGSFMPWIDPETLGPFRPGDYLYAYLALSLPTLLVMAAFCFALATMTRSMLGTYVGVVALLMTYFVSLAFFSRPEFEWIVSLIEPFGIGAFGYMTKYWTAAERNTRLPEIAGVILWNRAIWFGLGFVFLAAAWRLYRPEQKGARSVRRPEAEPAAERVPAPERGGQLAEPRHDSGTARTQLLALARFDMKAVFRSPAFFVLLGIGFVNSIGGLWFANQDLYGNPFYPVTRLMVQTLNGAFTMIPLIVAIYYAGELVWRGREQRTQELVDATPAPEWAFVLPKVLAIALVLLATVAAGMLAAIAVQIFRGYTRFELGNYVIWYVLPWTIDVTLFAVLALFVQVLVPHKFVGWLVMLLVLVSQIALGQLGYEHNLYQYAGGPNVPLSDMNGQGHFAADRGWFRAYWGAAAVILAALTNALWRRGDSGSLLVRLRALPRRLAGRAGRIAAAAAMAFLAVGGYIFYNTNVLNEYRTLVDDERRSAEYEKALLGFETVPQPRIVDVELNVEVVPRQLRVATTGRYTLENRQPAALREIHVRWARDTDLQRLDIPGGRLRQEFAGFNYRIYDVEPPLEVGARAEMRFATVREQRGFRNARNQVDIVGNGTFVNNLLVAPVLGMGREELLQDRAKRRKYGLPPELRLPKLEDEGARANHYLRRDSDWVTADITVSTDADQQAIAPGERVSETVADGRRVVRYRTSAPIMHFFSIQSAAYAVKHGRWNDVDLSVYYHPSHAYNVDRMMAAMNRSLDYFAANFGPFQFKQVRILEFPAYRTFAQSFAATIPYSEGIGFIASYEDPEKIDLVTYVTAHEVGHQWWAHQVMSGELQGMTVLVETLAQYSALMVMEHLYGPDQIRKFLKFELDRYLRSRGGEPIEELPLERVENQAYIHYQKGSLVMYLLKDIVGEDAVNRALRRLIGEFAFKAAPYPTSRDLLRHLRAEAGAEHQQLITDLFEKITLYDVKVASARKQPRADGTWDIALEIDARKLYADGEGRETEATLDEPFDIGIFTAEPGRKDFNQAAVLFFERKPIRSGRQTLNLVAAREPSFAGVDPYNKRVDRNSEDNVRAIDPAP
jgi:ABC-type transport system involved in multi-copper enzyme maturation permease subunit